MEFKKFYTTQDQLGIALKEIIDIYLDDELSNEEMISTVCEIVDLNKEVYFSNKEHTQIAHRVKAKLGKKRFEVISKVLELNE